MSSAGPRAQRTGLEGGANGDVLVVGAGISGIGAARYLAVDHPGSW
jgi:ribulose 1,5-bisphosphate synthetase/thiazole synthase